MVLVQLKCRGTRISQLPPSIDVSQTTPVSDFYRQIATALRYDVNRVRISQHERSGYLPSSSKDMVLALSERNDASKHGSSPCFYVKDLGPQISWRFVFLIEYIGPLLIHPVLYYSLRPTNADSVGGPVTKAQVICAMLTAHFIKRELETIFVHLFSQDTMPLSNLYKNCFHYWLLGGLNIGYWLYTSRSFHERSTLTSNFGIILYLVGEAWNFDTHLLLRFLRNKAKSAQRTLPHGHGFDLVTCPNYLAELISLLGVWVASECSLAVGIFVACSATQMLLWARRKEARYRTLFGESYRAKRWSMIPGLR